ncbi:hypothetical protein NRR22_003675 [Salmonella enterica]|nr:hypothetical protein [Salmonella enterica]
MINKYRNRLDSLITEYRKHALPQFEGPDGKRAHFDDLIWFHIDPNTGRKTRYLCGLHGIKGNGSAGDKAEFALSYPYNHLIKVFIIETASTSMSAVAKKDRVSTARKLLSNMNGELYAQTELTIASRNLHGTKDAERLRPFITFCSNNGLMQNISLKNNKDHRDRTGHAEFDARVNKLPEIESLIALGSIFATVFKDVSSEGLSDKEVKIKDAWVVTYALLGLASPSRLSAEVPVLPKQRLKKYSEGKDNPVHYLDWKGSKGFKDSKTHVLGAVSGEVEKAINFFFTKCEPARILCRFYENPKQSWGDLLGKFNIQEERKRKLNFDCQPNLFTLGYAIGFYEIDDNIKILKVGADPAKVYHATRGQFFEEKPIYFLDLDDRLSMSISRSTPYSSLPYLFGYECLPRQLTNAFQGMLTATLGEIQEWWLSFFVKSLLPSFPLAYSSGESSVRLADALFCMHGNWIYSRDGSGYGSSGKPFQISPFAVVPLNTLGVLASSKLSGSVTQTIFEEYGFSSELAVRPHSLRHFGNTLAHLSNIPNEIITAWSGRKSAEQTTTYIHSSHEERADRVRITLNRAENDTREIRVVTQENIRNTTNLLATVTSTGVCTQDLNTSPCDYLNDFVSQCFMCSEACHVAGDVKAIEFFEKDLSFQKSRLDAVSIDIRLPVSHAMQRWYVIHSRNTFILSQLIHLMKTSQAGFIIRYSAKKSEFYLSNLQTKEVSNYKCVLPDFEGALKLQIESRSDNGDSNVNPQLQSLLLSFGLSEKGA